MTDSTGRRVLDIEQDLVFSEYYLNLNLKVDNDTQLFGLGERFDQLEVKRGHNYTMWSYDAPMGNGKTNSDQETYGNQMVLLMSNPGRSLQTIVMLRTSSAVTVLAADSPDSTGIQMHLVGGVIDMKVFTHGSIKALMATYRRFLGAHAVPALWQLGHHQCRWGYKDYHDLALIMQNYNSSGIPIDTFWTDIDYLEDFKVFTNSASFPKQEMQALMAAYDKKYIPILDPTVSAKPTRSDGRLYQALVSGLQQNAFLMDPVAEFPMLSK